MDGIEIWGRMDTCICIVGSLCCSPSTITTLLKKKKLPASKTQRYFAMGFFGLFRSTFCLEFCELFKVRDHDTIFSIGISS